MQPAPAEVGSTANSYQILARLAVGGMAEIFLARGESVGGLARYCVLKRVLPERAYDIRFVSMFLDEARLAAQLQHPNVAQVYDLGKLGESYFFTMEYVHGETVRALLQRAKSLRREVPLGIVLAVIAQTAAGLHHAHARVGVDGRALHIVHRDVSPSNLMVSYEGNVKVVDFGVAKAADNTQETRAGTVKGKIAYLSPEQCKGIPVDRRSDLYALGIVMWEMLVLERLYKRDGDFNTMAAIVNDRVDRPSTRRPDVPVAVDVIVMKLLAKRPEDRFATADDVVAAIEDAAAANGIALSPSAVGRYLRELFGQRPEPWLELEAEHAEPVTVTSEPIPAHLVAPKPATVDRALANVPMLATAQMAAAMDSDSSASEERSTSRGPAELGEAPTVRSPSRGPTIPGEAPTVRARPPSIAPSAPHAPVPVVPPPETVVTMPSDDVIELPMEAFGMSPDGPPKRHGVSRTLLAGTIIASIAIGLALAIGMGGPRAPTRTADHPALVAVPPDAADAADSAIDAVEVDAIDVDAIEVDAAPPPPPIDAAAEVHTVTPKPHPHPRDPTRDRDAARCAANPMACQH